MNSKEILAKARELFNQGNQLQAIDLTKQIKDYSNDPDALYLMALCHATLNDYHEAEKLFLKVEKLAPPSEIIQGNIGLSQLHQEKFKEAIRSFRTAIGLNPAYYDAIKNIAVCYDHIQEQSNAKKYAEMASHINSNDPDIINILAKIALQNEDPATSISLYKRSLELHPQQPYTYTQLANAYVISKQYDTAEEVLKRLITLLPGNPYPKNTIAQFFESRNRHDDALSEYNDVLTSHTDNTRAIAGTIRCLVALKEFTRVDDLLHDFEKRYPSNSEIITEQCNYYILLKKYDDAYLSAKKFISNIGESDLVPIDIALSFSIACTHTNRPEEARDVLLSVIDKGTSSKDALDSLYFTLADALDMMKKYDEAFHHYRLANDTAPKPSDITYYETVLADIKNTVDRGFLDTLPDSGNDSFLPVFIVGMPRSGTSLVEQILSSHNDVYGAGELTDLWSIGNELSNAMNLLSYTNNLANITGDKLKYFSDRYLNKISELRSNESRVTDKLPHNFMHIGLIEKLFINARIIHCERHPFDTCLSIYFKKFNDNHIYARNLEETARFYKKYLELMNHWYTNSCLSIMTVRYEDMVENQDACSRNMIEHIGLEWDEDVLKYYESDRIIMTPSYHQASKPIYTGSVYRWKNYRDCIKPLTNILGDPEQYIVA